MRKQRRFFYNRFRVCDAGWGPFIVYRRTGVGAGSGLPNW